MNILNRAFGGTDQRNLKVVVAFIGSTWELLDAQSRSAVIAKLGPVNGFRANASFPWKRVAPAFTHGLRAHEDASVAKLLQQVWIAGLPELVDLFHAALHPDGRTDAVLGHAPPPESPIRNTHAWAPTVDDFLAAHRVLPKEQSERFGQFTVLVAMCGIPEWRGAANEAARAFFQTPPAPPSSPSAAASPPPPASPRTSENADNTLSLRPRTESNDSLDTATCDVLDHEDAATDREPTIGGPEFHQSTELEQLRALDWILIDAVVASANGQGGALKLPEIERVAEEFALLNLKRPQSCFHWGYALAFTGGTLPAHGPRFNVPRRAWIVAGWLIGHARTSPEAALGAWRALLPQDRHAVLKHPPAAQHAARPLVDVLITSGDIDALASWLPQINCPDNDLATAIRALGRRLQDAGRVADLRRVAAAIDQRLAEWGPALSLELQVCAVAALRKAGRCDECDGAMNELGREFAALIDPNGVPADGWRNLAARLLEEATPQAMLARAAIQRTEDLWFGRTRRPSDFASQHGGRLTEWCAWLKQTNDADRPEPELAYAAGLVVLCCNEAENASESCGIIARAIGLALPATNSPDAPEWMRLIAPRMRLLLRLVMFRDQRNAASCRDAVQAIIQFERNHDQLPGEFRKAVVEHAIIFGIDDVADIFVGLAQRDFAELIDDRLLDDALRYDAVRGTLIGRFDEVVRALTRKNAWTLRIALFKSLVKADVHDDCVARVADDLIGVIMGTQSDPNELITVFMEDERWKSVWETEADFAGVLALLARVSTDQDIRNRAALRIYQACLHEVHEPGGLAIAEDYLEALTDLHADQTWLDDARRQIEGQRAQHAPAANAGGANNGARPARVKVLFIGGDERQENAETRTRVLLSTKVPHADPTFEYPGWSANWGGDLTRVEGLIRNADVVVTMRYMRTMYGRHVRRMCNDHRRQWRATIGHGPVAIARAMAHAANAVA